MRSFALVLVVFALGCAGAPLPVAPKTSAPPLSLPPPVASAPPEAPVVVGLARAAAPVPTGCRIDERRFASVKLRLRPSDATPLFEGDVDERSVVLGADGSLHVTGTLLAGTLHVFGFATRKEVPVFTAAPFGGMVSTRANVRWTGTNASGSVRLTLDLPTGVTFDEQDFIPTDVACTDVKLTATSFAPLGGPKVYVRGDLARTPGGAIRLRGLHANGRRIGGSGDWVHVVVETGDVRATGWVKRSDVGEPAMGLGHGSGTGAGGAWAWKPGAGGIGCATPLAIYLPLPDGSFGEIARYAAGAPLWIHERAGEWATVELGPPGVPAHDLAWRARTTDLAACSTALVRAGTWR